jgi:hypothetical protein
VLQQLAGGHADGETLDIANVLGSRPLEFSPGKTGGLITVRRPGATALDSPVLWPNSALTK